MRIISGTHRGRTLHSPSPGSAIRPTSDRTREALFNILKHRTRDDDTSLLHGARFADICCGTGAVGCEALSHGAAHVSFVDASNDAITLSRRNAAMFDHAESCVFLRQSALQLPLASQPFDIIFTDPPYDHAMLHQLPDALIHAGWLDEQTLFITEQSVKRDPLDHHALALQEERKYGKNMLRFYKMQRSNEQSLASGRQSS